MSKNYGIILSWINEEKTNQVAPEEFLKRVIQWAKANSDDTIYVGYDAEFCTSEALQNSKNLLDELMPEIKCNNIEFIDFRDQEVVKKNKHLFAEGMPKYFKIDFAKLLYCYEILQSKKGVVYADLAVCGQRKDGQVMTREELWNPEIDKLLAEKGIVVNNDYELENQFIQMTNDKLALLCLRYAINTCLIIGNNLHGASFDIQKHCLPKLHVAPYWCAIEIIAKHYQAIKNGNFKICADLINKGTAEQWITYNPDKHNPSLMGDCIDPRSKKIIYTGANFTNDKLEFKFLDIKYSGLKFNDGLIYSAGGRRTDTRPGNDHSDKHLVTEDPALCFSLTGKIDEDIYQVINNSGLNHFYPDIC